MISAIDSNYKKICRHFDFGKNSHDGKDELLFIAECGNPKPHYKTNLYSRLCSFTNKNGARYDKIFDEKIRKLRPDWFLPRTHKSEIKKNQLLNLAINKKPRPTHKEKIYREFCSYTNKNNKLYDPIFDKKIRKLRPDWFLTRSDFAQKNKDMILRLKTKPKRHEKLGVALKNYINKSSQSYDHNFYRLLKKKKPNWF